MPITPGTRRTGPQISGGPMRPRGDLMAPFQGFVMVECVSLRDFPGVHRALTWYRTRREATARLAVIMETYPESPSGFLVTYAGQYHLDRVMQMLGGGGSAGTG